MDLGTYRLISHPATPPATVSGVEVRWIEPAAGQLMLRWQVDGCEQLLVPPFAGKGRANGLWQTTCFELYLGTDADLAYREFNFSPSERWAAYRFSDYRTGMEDLAVTMLPVISHAQGERYFVLTVTMAKPPKALDRAGFSAIIEETDGTKSYWALAHPAGKPDFHHPACFEAALPPPGKR